MTTATPAGIPNTGTWNIDSVHSSATFTVGHHKVATFRGHFHNVEGALVDGVLSGTVAVDNIDLGIIPMFKEHLLAADWFDGAQYPTLSFTSTDLHAHGDHLHASGELTIKDVTKSVEIGGGFAGPVAVTTPDGKTADRLGVDLTTTINRRDFNIVGEGGAEDIVTIEVSLELVAAN